MAAVSAAACVADVDRDGLLDVLLVNSGPKSINQLYRNVGEFRFERWSMPGVEDLNVDGFSSDCVFADVDNDGFEDLFVGTACQQPRLFMNALNPQAPGGRTFVDVTASSGLPNYMNGFSASFFDANQDGNINLIFADYFRGKYDDKDVPGSPPVHNFNVPDAKGAGQMMPNDWGGATNGGEKFFLLGDGKGHFELQDLKKWGFSETRFTFDIGTADINQDGFTVSKCPVLFDGFSS
ncbi:MAG: VCBS repeat-containing protein [Deltaproteobacteria bacterium]|nr:VCBS repeat-containing protein [Deltaproteobacteria bacterium]